MKPILLLAGAVALTVTVLQPTVSADDGLLRLTVSGTNTLLLVTGDPDDEWRFQTSSDLVAWSNAPALGTLFSGPDNTRSRSVGQPSEVRRFYRAVKTTGLYDVQVLRTLSLTFTQSNWQNLLTANHATGSNLAANLVLDNGKTNTGVGVRYRGNTSYTMGGAKKSLNIELDYTEASADLMGYNTINLNNAAGDETILREPLYFNLMRQYAPCPRGSLIKLYINGAYWGVYSFVQQEDSDLVKEWFPSRDGDRWRTPNVGGGMGGGNPGGGFPGGGGGGNPGGGGGFSSALSALSYLGANEATYQANYELKTENSTNAWSRLVHAIDVLNNTPLDQLRDRVEDVLAVDRWLWFLVLENVFADDDSYFNKGADYGFYYEPESGRIHPIEHDGNESFIAGDVQLSPVQGATSTNRPVLAKLLSIPELRQRYLAHLRTVLEESFNPTVTTALVNQYSALTVSDITADPKKNFTMAAYNSDLAALKTFIASRYKYLTNHAELTPSPPRIAAVYISTPSPVAGEIPFVTADVRAIGANGVDSVWLYHRDKPFGRFTTVQMFDDGAHGDGAANDSIFGAATTHYPAGDKVHFYVEARSANSAKAASFAPARAEPETYSYRVALSQATSTPVVINELMALNQTTLADPQGEFDDWIELRNLTDREVDLTGRYLSDEPNNPRKWPFPSGTTLPANGYLLVWADENGNATPGLHASFKLSASGEQVYLADTDANFNAVLDYVIFGPQEADRSYGRSPDNADVFRIMNPTPGTANK